MSATKAYRFVPGMTTVPFGRNIVWTRKADPTLRTEAVLAPTRHLTKFLKSFGSTVSHYTDRDILVPISVPIQLQGHQLNENLIFIKINKKLKIKTFKFFRTKCPIAAYKPKPERRF